MQILNALKAYNQNGLLSALTALVSFGSLSEETVKVTNADSALFHIVERRLARTRLLRAASMNTTLTDEFNEQVIGFTSAMSACYEYLNDKTRKTRRYTVELKYFGKLETSPAYIFTIRNISTGDVTLTSIINGLY